MAALRPLRWLILLVVLGTALWKVLPLPARTLTFQDENCACKIPYNWSIKNNPKFILEAQRGYDGIFFIAAKPASPSFTIEDPAFKNTVKTKVESDGFEVTAESQEPFQGHPAYTYTMRKSINGKLIYTHSINFVAGKFRYDLVTTKRDADPADDAQLKAAVDSFSLIEPNSP